MSEENPADYGSPKTELPIEDTVNLSSKKDEKTEPEEKTSTETPDPNVKSLGSGETTGTDSAVSGTVTGRSNVTRSRSTPTTDET